MKRIFLLAPLLACALAAAALTQTVIQDLPDGAPVVLAGRVSSPPKGWLDRKKMQVAVGPRRRDYTVHFAQAEVTDHLGRPIDEDGLDSGQWVRVEGSVTRDRRRIRASRVRVVSEDDLGFRRSAFARPGYGFGYLVAAAEARELFPTAVEPRPVGGRRILLVGRVSDDTGALEVTRRIQVKAAGNEWTLKVGGRAEVRDATGKSISVHEIAVAQWVRAVGRQTEDLQIQVERLDNVGPDGVYRRSPLFQDDSPGGYVQFPDADSGAAPPAPAP